MAVEISKVDAIIDRHGFEQRGLIPSLLEIQDEFHYLPQDALRRVSASMDIPMNHIGHLLDIEPGQTSTDMLFTLEVVNCLGCCSIGPVMTLDGKYYGSMAASKVERVLDIYREREATAND
jgi:NADH-quinone oxidoreductase subunit E